MVADLVHRDWVICQMGGGSDLRWWCFCGIETRSDGSDGMGWDGTGWGQIRVWGVYSGLLRGEVSEQ